MENRKMSQGATGKILLRTRKNLVHVIIVPLKTKGVFKYQFYVTFNRKTNGGRNTCQCEDLFS